VFRDVDYFYALRFTFYLIMLNDVIGHKTNIDLLKNSLRSGRIANAYLFAGPPDVGKEFIAVNFAKALNCLDPRDDCDACGVCISCRKIDDGNHPDVRKIGPDGAWIKIDQIRDLQRQISYKPMEGRRKVYITLDAERMTRETANSFLKTLEEPPGTSTLILVTTNMNALLSTIRSRCQILKFSNVPRNILRGKLIERFIITEAEAKSIVMLSGGKVGKAYKLAQDNDFSIELDMPKILRKSDRIEVFKIAEELSQNPDGLDLLLTWYRDLLLIKQNCQGELLTHSDKLNELSQIANDCSRLQIHQAIETIMKTKQMIQRNINSMLAMEVMVFKLLSLRS